MRPTFDERDAAILTKRQALLDARPEWIRPQVGDWIIYPDGSTARVAHRWDDLVQPSIGAGSFYLGDGYASFSGSLARGATLEHFHATGETLPGPVWFFHHDFHTAHNGVEALARFKVWRCDKAAP